MEIYCSRPGCSKPLNQLEDLDPSSLKAADITQKYCDHCGMPLILDGRYILEKPIARGDFGITYLARDRRTPTMKQCIVKQFLPQGSDPDQMSLAKQLFEREGLTLEHIGTHPQIPDLLAFFEMTVEGENYFYLVQEYIDGYTLENIVQELGPLPEGDVVEMLQRLLPVLQFIHDRKSIHRDIKPANIIVHRQTQQYYLLDFGAVKQITSAMGPPPRQSTSIYTVGFSAPEQMRGEEVYPSTDIYALGATCVFLLTGKQPADLIDPRTNAISWRPYAPSLSDHLGIILDHMLAQSPSDRYPSAQAVLEALPLAHTPRLSASTTAIKSPQLAPSHVLRSVLHIPLRSLLVSGFALGFALGLWGVLALSQGFALMGPLPSLFILAGTLLGLLFLRSQQILDNKDMLAVDVISFFGVLILKAIFRSAFALPTIGDLFAISLVSGFGLSAVLVMFRLIYRLFLVVL